MFPAGDFSYKLIQKNKKQALPTTKLGLRTEGTFAETTTTITTARLEFKV